MSESKVRLQMVNIKYNYFRLHALCLWHFVVLVLLVIIIRFSKPLAISNLKINSVWLYATLISDISYCRTCSLNVNYTKSAAIMALLSGQQPGNEKTGVPGYLFRALKFINSYRTPWRSYNRALKTFWAQLWHYPSGQLCRNSCWTAWASPQFWQWVGTILL